MLGCRQGCGRLFGQPRRGMVESWLKAQSEGRGRCRMEEKEKKGKRRKKERRAEAEVQPRCNQARLCRMKCGKGGKID